jgi:hypothetical protein
MSEVGAVIRHVTENGVPSGPTWRIGPKVAVTVRPDMYLHQCAKLHFALTGRDGGCIDAVSQSL